MRGVPIEALERLPLFADLTPRELQSVARLFKDRRFPKDEMVVTGGLGRRRFLRDRVRRGDGNHRRQGTLDAEARATISARSH